VETKQESSTTVPPRDAEIKIPLTDMVVNTQVEDKTAPLPIPLTTNDNKVETKQESSTTVSTHDEAGAKTNRTDKPDA